MPFIIFFSCVAVHKRLKWINNDRLSTNTCAQNSFSLTDIAGQNMEGKTGNREVS